ncbi:MAG: hydrogen gas-evolving membrane-bound hydrogenase subunit E, partial [Bacteroidales bacterium]
VIYAGVALILAGGLLYFFIQASQGMDPFGVHTMRMSDVYVNQGVELTGSMNLVAAILFDFRGYDTLGEATILITAVIGILTILRIKGRK